MNKWLRSFVFAVAISASALLFCQHPQPEVYLSETSLDWEDTQLIDTATQHPHKLHPSNTMFAFDFDGVLAQANIPEMIRTILLTQNGWKFLLGLGTTLLHHPQELLASGAGAEPLSEYLLTQGKPKVADFIMSLASTQSITTGINALLEHTSTYDQAIATNRDWRAFEYLQEQPNLAPIFKKLKKVLVVNDFSSRPGYEGTYFSPVKKPDKEYYYRLQKYLNPENKTIIFMDDRLENVVGAQQAADEWNEIHEEKMKWISIHFKSVKQLRDILNQLQVKLL